MIKVMTFRRCDGRQTLLGEFMFFVLSAARLSCMLSVAFLRGGSAGRASVRAPERRGGAPDV